MISFKKKLLISNLLTSPTIDEACEKTGINRKTYYLWLKDKKFKDALKRQRNGVVKEAINRLKCSTTRAVDELIKLLDTSRPELRRATCKDILDYSLRVIELEDIEERLDRIEKIVLERSSNEKYRR
jgi:hypothetical protein